MQSFENISKPQYFTFGNTEKGSFCDFQNTDYQHWCCRIFSSTFTGKELDAETGFSYFGARCLDHALMTSWLSVDPMADKYPSISPYAYCAWNPMKIIDFDGGDVGKIHIPLYSQNNRHGSPWFEGLISHWSDNPVIKYYL